MNTEKRVNIINFKLESHQTVIDRVNKLNVLDMVYPLSGRFLNIKKLIGKVIIKISSRINNQANIGYEFDQEKILIASFQLPFFILLENSFSSINNFSLLSFNSFIFLS